MTLLGTFLRILKTKDPVVMTERLGTVATFSRGILKLAHGPALIGCELLVHRPARPQGIDAVVGWGHKANTMLAIEYAQAQKLPYFRLEDGFLRSVGLGVDGDTALSMVMDDEGIYYDARRPSRLESILLGSRWDCETQTLELLARAKSAMAKICKHQLSKYNNAPLHSPELSDNGGRQRVLVVDQTFGDLSVSCGLATEGTFLQMLEAAHRENPEAEILVKTHPDVLGGKKRGYLGLLETRPRLRVLASACNAIALLGQVDKVYVVTSQLGFEALLLGKPVTCFGAPFYSGWGLTEDRKPVARRGVSRTLEQVFAAAYILYSRYVDPDTGVACELERVIDHLALQRQEFRRNQGNLFCFGFSTHPWKKTYVRSYLRCPGNTIHFPRSAAHAERLGFDQNSKIVVWGRRAQAGVQRISDKFGVSPWCMEDGFLRSVGLGSDLNAPASLVVDREGIYFDPSRPSELETILQTVDFSESQLRDAGRFRRILIKSGLSKYNVGDTQRRLPISSEEKSVILVPGQVEDDASIVLGCRDIATNWQLLQEVRAARPEAFIVFKPHPDVISGNRKGNIPRDLALSVCDHVEDQASLAQCLKSASEVHVMTSLVGFEGLLRGLAVFTYGQPFYAGWGLTTDRHPVSRRSRKLDLDQLVAAVYLVYPRYLNRETMRFTSAFSISEELARSRDHDAESLRVSWVGRTARKLRHIGIAFYKGASRGG